MKNYVIVIGAGLAGSEAALQLSKRKIRVRLFEMKPAKRTPAHKSEYFGELVCSNSLRSVELTRAAGVLKAELNVLDSELLKLAVKNRVPAGVSLSVDREKFAREITELIKNNPYIEVINEEVKAIPDDRPLIIATGPLTSSEFLNSIANFLGSSKFLRFYDAVAPLVYADSIDMSKVFIQDRYGKGKGSYINCPMTEEEYDRFYEALINAEKHQLEIKGEEKYFEACLPVEELARRGKQALLFGPLKPVGLVNPHTGKRPYAVVQLRQDDVARQLYNIVGFQTNLTYSEQKRVFSMIPGLENVEFARYGKMHLNSYIESNKYLNSDLSLRTDNRVFFAGQITGSEGYIEAIATGLVAGINAARLIQGKKTLTFPESTMIGSLIKYLTDPRREDTLQPMHASFGILPPLEEKLPKKVRYFKYAERAISNLREFCNLLL